MRLHHLRAEAFGPFNAPVEVDFDALSAAGLFLLAGPTGAGKTSILDAVCFALYGDVPGDRSTAKRLRCDHAPPHATPRVTLELTLAARRFQLVRSPAWDRPKKRGGGGTTREPAKVTLSELVDGAWTPLSSRIDEVGDLVVRVLGMNLGQFTQVALLPQGQFQAFLRADSPARHAVLQRLFRTGRYEQVEAWLAERRRSLTRLDEEYRRSVAALVHRISEASDLEPPEAGADAPGAELQAWSAGARDTALVRAHDAEADTKTRSSEHAAAREAWETGRALAERLARLEAARREAAELERTEAAHAGDVARLDAARRAESVRPVHELARRAAAEWETARRRWERALAALDSGDEARDAEWGQRELSARLEQLAGHAAELNAALPREARLAELRDVAAALADHAAALRDDDTELATRQEALPARLAVARDREAAAAHAVAALPALTERVGALEARREAHLRALELDTQRAEAHTLWLEAKERTLALKETLLDLQTRRVAGMAAELAVGLASGCACPVCGSVEHPHRAEPAAGAPDARAEKAARAAVDTAEAEQLARHERWRDLERLLAEARSRAGDVERLDHELAAAREESAHARHLAAAHADHVAEVHRCDQEAAALAGQREQLAAERARVGAEADSARAEAREIDLEISALLHDTGHTGLGDLLDAVRARLAVCRDALEASRACASAAAAAVEADEQAAAVAERAGFDDVGAALSAVLAPADLDALADTVVHRAERRAAVAEVLKRESDVSSAAPDLESLARSLREALEALQAARSTAERWRERHERLSRLDEELRTTLDAWEPHRDDLAHTARLAAFCEGKSADNRLRMRLSAYVLAYRLGQVVAAANARLGPMSGHRYALEHTAERGAGETRGGLSLAVRDDWSGESRDPATLSGGETFVVSLALALGLADVVAHEAGGISLETLFVDEGFGSLDADTLDAVMDILDTLRDGGRVVGVVSHVPELRERIATRVQVDRARTGSRVTLVGV